MNNPLKRFFGEPLVQFLLIGGCIYGLFALFGTSEEEIDENLVHIDSARIGSMITQWESRWNRPPTRDEIEGLIETTVKEEVLYRQAVKMGLGENDPITRRRMAQKLEFLTSDLAGAMQPADGELEDYYSENAATYRAPDRITFVQVFFNPDDRKDGTLDEAKAELETLRSAGKPDAATLEAGDRSMVRGYFEATDRAGVVRDMGGGFADAVMGLEAGQWHGPVLSGYGVHLVYVYERTEGTLPEFESVKEKVLEDWHDQQSEQFNVDFLENLKSRYDIVIDELPGDRLIGGSGKGSDEQESKPAETPES